MDKIDINDELIERIKSFLSRVDIYYKSHGGLMNLNDTEFVTECLIYQMKTGENILEQHLDIGEKVRKYISFETFIEQNREYGYWDYYYNWNEIREKSLLELEELLSGNYHWAIPEGVTAQLKETQKKMKETLTSPLGKSQAAERRKEITERYYDYTFVDYMGEFERVKKEIKNLQLLPMEEVESKVAVYPLILLVFDKHNNVISIKKVEKNLEAKLEDYNNKYPECRYGYLAIDKDIIEHIFAELCVYYNPKYLNKNAFSSRQSPYKSFNLIVQRYKGEMGITSRVIRKVCELYSIDIHYLNNNVVVIDRNKINKALTEYTGRNFIDAPVGED